MAAPPVIPDPEVSIISATVGPYTQDPVWPDNAGCRLIVTASLLGIPKGRVYAGAVTRFDIPEWGTQWYELGYDVRLTRDQTQVIFTAHAPLRPVEYSQVVGFRVDLYKQIHGRYIDKDIIATDWLSATLTEADCQPPA